MFETLDEPENKDRAQTEDSEGREKSAAFEGPPTLAFIFAAALTVASLVLGRYGNMRGCTAITYLAVAVFTMGLFWRLRSRVWFWTTYVLLLSGHGLLVVFAPLSEYWLRGKNMFGVDVADVLFYCLGIVTVSKVTESFNKNERQTE